MSNVPLKDGNNADFKVDSFVRSEAGQDVHMQAVVPVDPATGLPNAATEATLLALKNAIDGLNTLTVAIKAAVEGLNTAVKLDSTSLSALENVSVSGQVSLDATTLAALENINAATGGLTDAQLRAAALIISGQVSLDAPTLAALENVVVSGQVSLDSTTLAALENINASTGGLTDAQLRATAIVVSLDAASLGALESVNAQVTGTVALDATTLAALESITASTGGLTDTQLRATPLDIDKSGLATESTLDELNQKIPAHVGGRLPVELPPGGSGLTDGELRASNVAVSDADLSALNTTLTVFMNMLLDRLPRINHREHVLIDASETSLGVVSTVSNLSSFGTVPTNASLDGIPHAMHRLLSDNLYRHIV